MADKQVKEKKEKAPKAATKKSRWFVFEVYPDNPAQMAAFEWLKTSDIIEGGMYIYHKAETGEKDHIHVMIYRDIPLSTVRHIFPDGEKWLCPSISKWFGTMEAAIVDNKWYYKEYSEGYPDNISWQTMEVIGHIEGCSDPVSYGLYMYHKRFCDRNKIQYDWNDMQYFGKSDRLKHLFEAEGETEFGAESIIRKIATAYGIETGHGAELMDILIREGHKDLSMYVRKHTYMTNYFLLNPRKDRD